MAHPEERRHHPVDPAAVAPLPAVHVHRVRRRALAGRRTLPGFDFDDGYTAFQFVFVLLQSAAFGGVFTGFGIARDFEGGFARRLLLASPSRSGIVLGYAIAALPPLGDRRRRGHRRRPRGGHGGVGGNPAELVGDVLARAARERVRLPVVGGDRDALPVDPGRAADADARLPPALLRARLRAARPALRARSTRSRCSTRSRTSWRPGAASSPGSPRRSRWRSASPRRSLGALALWAFRGLRRAEAAG